MDFKLNTYSKEGVNKQQFEIKTNRKDGLIIQIHHTIPCVTGEIKLIRFKFATFNDPKEQIAASDYRANIFIIDLSSNKYWLLPNLGSCSVISFVPNAISTLLTGTSDGTLHFMNVETGKKTSSLTAHKTEVKQISYSSEYYCLSFSNDEAIIWDLRTETQAHKLTLQSGVGVKQVLFMPVTNNILACFEDDVMNIWKYESFESLKQILPSASEGVHLKCIAFTKDGRAMILGGLSKNLIVFLIDNWTFKKVIPLPDSIESVIQMQFIPQIFDGGANKILAILSNKKQLHIINIESCEYLYGFSDNISKFVCSPNGKYLVSVRRSGQINLYNVDQLLQQSKTELPPTQTKLLYETQSTTNKQDVIKRSTPKSPIKQKKTVKDAKNLSENVSAVHTKQDHLNEIQNELRDLISVEKLKPILDEYKQFPTKYRALIWRYLLKLPGNRDAYQAIIGKGSHPAFKNTDKEYPLKSKSCLRNLNRLLSDLAYWSPLFSEVKYLPVFVFPFLQVFENDGLSAFEALCTIVINYCQYWFEYYPLPPVNILILVENILAEHDSDLLSFYSKFNITYNTYAWPMLENAFSEILETKNWLILWDHILLSYEPTYLIFVVVAYNIVQRNIIQQFSCVDSIEKYFRSQNLIDMNKLLKETMHLLNNTSHKNHPRQYLKDFEPLMKGSYIQFDQYPKIIIDHQAQTIEQIRKEEEEIIREEKEALEKMCTYDLRLKDIITKEEHDKRMTLMEQKYREALFEEERRLGEKRLKMLALKRDLRNKELEILEDTRNSIMKESVGKRNSELCRVLDDIERKKHRDMIQEHIIEEELQTRYIKLLSQKEELERRFKGSPTPLTLPEQDKLENEQQQLRDKLNKLYDKSAESYLKSTLDIGNNIAAIDSDIQITEATKFKNIANEFSALESGCTNMKTLLLEEETKKIEEEVQQLLGKIRNNSSKEREKNLNQPQNDITKSLNLIAEQSRVIREKNKDVSIEPDKANKYNSALSNTKDLLSCTSRYSTMRDSNYFEKEKATIKSITELRNQLLNDRKSNNKRKEKPTCPK